MRHETPLFPSFRISATIVFPTSTSEKLYFEPLTVEDVLSIYRKEKPEGVIVQFGGQIPLNIADELEAEGVKILGTTPQTIDLAEDRKRFGKVMRRLGIPMPPAGTASTMDEAFEVASRIGYPLIVRPSYVLGGRGMEIIHEEPMLESYVKSAVGISPERPILIDKFLENATEVETDAISDGNDVFISPVMQHIEYEILFFGVVSCHRVNRSRKYISTSALSPASAKLSYSNGSTLVSKQPLIAGDFERGCDDKRSVLWNC